MVCTRFSTRCGLGKYIRAQRWIQFANSIAWMQKSAKEGKKQQEQSKKRKAEETPMKSSKDEKKKAKTEQQTPQSTGKKKEASQSEGSTPAKSPTTPSGANEYEKQLREVLKQNGKMPLSALGSKVKRPPSVAKLGSFIKERTHIFNVQGDQVELAKGA